MDDLDVRVRGIEHRQRHPEVPFKTPSRAPRVLDLHRRRAPYRPQRRSCADIPPGRLDLMPTEYLLPRLRVVDASRRHLVGFE